MLGTAGALFPCSFPAPFSLLSLLKGQVKLAEKEEGEGEEEEEEGRSGEARRGKALTCPASVLANGSAGDEQCALCSHPGVHSSLQSDCTHSQWEGGGELCCFSSS